MADIELVIKISEEQYNAIKSNLYDTFPAEMKEWGLEAIRNGTPLPKGYGKLIDADSMKTMKNIQSAMFNAVELIRLWIDKQDTIIEADKVESGDRNDV